MKDVPRSAWAIKNDAKGNLLWRHVLLRTDNVTYGETSYHTNPIYNSVAVMSDGSAFMCGYMPTRARMMALLTHLDKNGKVLSTQVMAPEHNAKSYRFSEFLSCGKMDDGLVVIGHTLYEQPTAITVKHPLSADTIENYWVVYFYTCRGVQI